MAKIADIERYIDRDIRNLHPAARDAFSELAVDLSNQFERKATRTAFRLFEGYRSPARQNYLFNQTPQVTKAHAWTSAHNYGLACDFVAWVFEDGVWQWSWESHHDWAFLKQRAAIFGLTVPITWDIGHVEHPAWKEHGALLRNM